jgi:signal transduction histidine kinase
MNEGIESIKVTRPRRDFETVTSYLDLVGLMLAQVAVAYEADISTLFRVAEDRSRLVLEAGYDSSGRITASGTSPYVLNWEATRPEHIRGCGVTAWVAVSGKSLFIPNLVVLRAHPAYGGAGAWDKLLFPKGAADPDTGFGCMYAVPLRRSDDGPPRQTLIGVFKIERRIKKEVFSEGDRKAFDLAAGSISRALEVYGSTATTLRRVLSEAAHILRGRLADTLSVIQMCNRLLATETPDVTYARTNLGRAERLLDTGCSRIGRVIDAFRGSQLPELLRLGEIISAAVAEAFEDPERCAQTWDLSRARLVNLNRIQRYDFETILINLLRNADQHSRSSDPVELSVTQFTEPFRGDLVRIVVRDRGVGLSRHRLEQIKTAAASPEDDEPFLLSRPAGGTGLKRVYRLAHAHAWLVRLVDIEAAGTAFEIIGPQVQPDRSPP